MTPHEQFTDIAKAAPPITVTGMSVLGFSISEWVLLLTAIYTVLQIYLIIRRIIRTRKNGDAICTADCPARQIK
jgi:hypothetical protein